MSWNRIAPCVAAALLAVIVALDLTSMRHLSVTYDEDRHFRYGQQMLRGDASRFDASKMPVSVLNAIPEAIAARLPDGPVARALSTLEAGRYVTVAFSLLVALCVYRWAGQLYGAAAAVAALALYTFDPNVLAHSQLVTNDVYAAGTMTWALYSFWRYLRGGGPGHALLSAFALGLAQVAKYTGIFLYPLYPVIALAFHAAAVRAELAHRDRRALARRVTHAVAFAALVAAVNLAVVNAAFFFDRTLTPLDGYTFKSQMFEGVQQRVGPLGRVPIPLPYPYLEGLDWIVHFERTGESYGPIYMNGELRQGRGFAGYYLFASLYKVPIATLVMWLAALAGLAGLLRPRLTPDEWVLVVPIVFFGIYFNTFYRAQIGLRYFLVIFPALHILAGRVLRHPAASTRAGRAALAAGGVYLVASVASYHPHYIPYFNELVGDRRLAYRLLADSNVDWGQHLWYQEQYMAAHPGAIIEPERPTAGLIIVGINSLTGVGGAPERFRWLREHFRPIDHIAYSTLVYRVTPEDLVRLHLQPSP